MIKINNREIVFGRFPNNEINLPLKQLDNLEKQITVVWDYQNNEEIFALAMLKQYLDARGHIIDLFISYLPYSRMDRVNEIYSVSLDCISKIINDMNFNKVFIREPHSNASLEKVRHSEPIWWCEEKIFQIVREYDIRSLFFPDKGAMNRYNVDNPISKAFGKKKRNFDSGEIIEYDIEGTVTSRVLIVDDLCSRGGTFIRAAKKLKEKGAKNVYLLVAHCENNIFNGNIFDYIDTIFTSKEMLDKDHPRIIKLD